MTLSDSTRRALRGAIQFAAALPGIVATFQVAFAGNPSVTVALTTVLAWTTLASKVINQLEDAGVIPALLKAPASEGADPIPDGSND